MTVIFFCQNALEFGTNIANWLANKRYKVNSSSMFFIFNSFLQLFHTSRHILLPTRRLVLRFGFSF